MFARRKCLRFEIPQEPFQQLVQRRALFLAQTGDQALLVLDMCTDRFLDNGKSRLC